MFGVWPLRACLGLGRRMKGDDVAKLSDDPHGPPRKSNWSGESKGR